MEIPDIRIGNLDIKSIKIVDVMTAPSTSIPNAPPVVLNIGLPIVDMPGCVEAHETNNVKNNKINEDDTNGLVTYCDSGLPNFNPISFEPEQLIYTGEAEVPPVKSPESPEVPEAPEVKSPVKTANVDCPTPVQKSKEPVGTLVNGFRDRVIGYELIGKQCIQNTESVPIQIQLIEGLPSAGAVTATASIAIVATTSALLAKPLADLLLKVVKPTVKKVMKKIATLRGKKIPVQSASERVAEQRQRNQAVKILRSVRPLKK
tara:strand:- start:455 stop:1237 length:783 start_codon:yes stop_codon:yes gene_type:complete